LRHPACDAFRACRAIVDLAAVRNKLVDAHTRLAELDRWFEDTHTSGYMHLPGGAPGSSAAAHRAPDASAQQTNTEPGRLCISPGQPGSDEAGRPGGRRISLSPTAKERARRGSAPSLHAPLSTVPPLPSPRRLRAPATDMLEGSDSVASSTPRSRRSSETVNLLRERRDSEVCRTAPLHAVPPRPAPQLIVRMASTRPATWSRSLLRSGAYRRTSTLDGWQPSSVLSRC